MSFQLADMLSGDMSPVEMQAIVDRHEAKLEAIERELDDREEKERDQLMNELSEKHQVKLNQLVWKHEQMVSVIVCGVGWGGCMRWGCGWWCCYRGLRMFYNINPLCERVSR